jgi:hypothetical protein
MNSSKKIQEQPNKNEFLSKVVAEKKGECNNCNGCHCVLKEKTQEILNKLTSIK